MSEATLNAPRTRADQNRWYLYFDMHPRYGPEGCARAVIEEVCDEIYSGDGGPTRARRKVYVLAEDVLETSRNQWDHLEQEIEIHMSDDRFRCLIANGTVIPIKTP